MSDAGFQRRVARANLAQIRLNGQRLLVETGEHAGSAVTGVVGDSSLTIPQGDYDRLEASGSIVGLVLRSRAGLLMIVDTPEGVGTLGYGTAVVPASRHVRKAQHLRSAQPGQPGPWQELGEVFYSVEGGSVYVPATAGVRQGDVLDLAGGTRKNVVAVRYWTDGINRLVLE